jgi:hypothetical protein
MSIDTSDDLNCGLPPAAVSSPPHAIEQWDSVRRKIEAHIAKQSFESVFGAAAKGGSVYRWGVAACTGEACSDVVKLLSRVASDTPAAKLRIKKSIGIAELADSYVERFSGPKMLDPIDASLALLWAAALPGLSRHLDHGRWWRMLSSLEQLRESVLQRDQAYLPSHLMLGGELGMTLAWRLGSLPTCKRLRSSSIDAISAWCRREEESISAALAGFANARLVLASLIRCQRILESTGKRKVRRQHRELGDELATWVAAATIHTGSTAFSAAGRKEVRDDLPPDGLLAHAVEYDPEALGPATSAALGATQTGGRLAWQVSLPESMLHDSDAKVAVLLPEWDVRRGRTHVDYSGDDVRLEIFAGRTQVVGGAWQNLIEVDDQEQQACGDWTEVCQYTDDDVHYLEIEQTWTGGVLLQRQLMLIREDRCLLLADAVIPQRPGQDPDLGRIHYTSRIPLPQSIEVEPELDTREVFLKDSRRRVLAIPLGAGEWRIGPSSVTLKESEDHHLLLSAQGRGRLYAPLWLDFQQRRFTRKRTWRHLTVADALRIVRADEATGYRVQVGSEQWVIYRSLGERCCRTLLGKHLLAEFFCSRFDSGDGSHDELVTVEDGETEDD